MLLQKRGVYSELAFEAFQEAVHWGVGSSHYVFCVGVRMNANFFVEGKEYI